MRVLRRTKLVASSQPDIQTDLNGSYWNFFEVLPAYTEEERREAYRVRYQVLCEERQLLSPGLYSEGEEQDSHDNAALHSILRFRATGETVGTIRVILPEGGHHELPSFAICPDMAVQLPAVSTVEISRLCISRRLRKRWNDGVYGFVSHEVCDPADDRRAIPHPAIGLFRDALAQMQGRGITHACALMEPALATRLRRLGIHFAPAGMSVDYYGLRQPCYAKVSSLLDRVMAERPDIWHFLTDGGRLAF